MMVVWARVGLAKQKRSRWIQDILEGVIKAEHQVSALVTRRIRKPFVRMKTE